MRILFLSLILFASVISRADCATVSIMRPPVQDPMAQTQVDKRSATLAAIKSALQKRQDELKQLDDFVSGGLTQIETEYGKAAAESAVVEISKIDDYLIDITVVKRIFNKIKLDAQKSKESGLPTSTLSNLQKLEKVIKDNTNPSLDFATIGKKFPEIKAEIDRFDIDSSGIDSGFWGTVVDKIAAEIKSIPNDNDKLLSVVMTIRDSLRQYSSWNINYKFPATAA